MYGREAILHVDWVYLIPEEREQTMFSWTETLRRRFQEAYQGMRQKQNEAVRRNTQLYKPLTQHIKEGSLVWHFDPRVIAETSHKLRSSWIRPYRVLRIIAPSLAEINHMHYPEKKKIVSLDILKIYRGGGRGGEHIIQGFEEDDLPGDMMLGAELTEIPNLGEGGENGLVSRTDSGEGEGITMENPIAPAVEGGPLEQEMENMIIRTQTDQPAERKVIREDKEDVDMEEEGKGGEVPPPHS